MEMPIKENPMPRSDSTSSNQLFIAENLDLPDDTFRMSLDYMTEIGENVTIGGRDTSIDSVRVKYDSITAKTPSMPITPTSSTHKSPVPESPLLPPEKQSCETPKLLDDLKDCKQINLLKQSLTKKENDVFVRPSPVAEVMSPAKMLQFEIDVRSSATPTMKRAAIDFNFFNDNKFEEYFKDENNSNEKETGVAYKETPVIVKASTVRHEIGYGLWDISILANLRSLLGHNIMCTTLEMVGKHEYPTKDTVTEYSETTDIYEFEKKRIAIGIYRVRDHIFRIECFNR